MDPCLAVGGTAKYMNLSSAELAERQRLHLYRPQSAVTTAWDGTAMTFDIGAAVSTEKKLGAERPREDTHTYRCDKLAHT